MQNKQASGFAAIPILFLITLVAVGLLFLREQLKPVPLVPPMYKIGDCFKNSVDAENPDGHEVAPGAFKVLSVGKKNYELLYAELRNKTVYVKIIKGTIKDGDEGTEKVDCPKALNDPKTLQKAQNDG